MARNDRKKQTDPNSSLRAKRLPPRRAARTPRPDRDLDPTIDHATRIAIRQRWWRVATVVVPLVVMALSGCLGEPEIDERWTMLEFVNMDPQPDEATPPGQTVDVAVRGRITYRQILTGIFVAEVRYAPSISPGLVSLDPDEHTLAVAQDVDWILANSITAGRATKPVTGFDHLMQDIDLAFTAQVPDSAASGGVYLLLYMGDGDEIQLAGGRDSLVVTPFVSTEREVLHTGFPLNISTGGTP